ncbi:MAG TPA: PIN-like domain-containing protein [Rhizomicrobium sp.]
MFFPDIIPSRDQCLAAVAAALSDANGRVYLDTSVLIHCYEMNVAASEDLLNALASYGDRVGVAAWAANETWEHASKRTTRRPLKASADRVREELSRFKKESTRYIDDDALKDIGRDEFQRQLDLAVQNTVGLVQKVANYEPKADQTTARLLPFIDTHRLPSDLTAILDVVARTAAMRVLHRVPPGFSDGIVGAEASDDDENGGTVKGKGKRKNPHGDLIIWLEILADCHKHNAEHLILITRDTTKSDWVYVPRKVLDEKGRPQDNGGVVTLPLPLLVQEAMQRCPTLNGVHIVSVEMLAHVLRRLKIDIGNLAAAIQAGDDRDSDPPLDVLEQGRALDADAGYQACFESADMSYEGGDDDLDRLIRDLNGEGWKVQNAAVRGLEAHLASAGRDQRVQIGRGLVAAGNHGAVDPVDFLTRALANVALSRGVRSDILIGALAEVYITETGEPKKPEAIRAIAELLFRHERDTDLAEAYAVVLGRLRPQSRKYLALPTDHANTISLDVALERGVLRGASAFGHALLEEDAPSDRAIQRTGRDSEMTLQEFLELMATEFVIPVAILTSDVTTNARVSIPTLVGYVPWGPNTGTLLR